MIAAGYQATATERDANVATVLRLERQLQTVPLVGIYRAARLASPPLRVLHVDEGISGTSDGWSISSWLVATDAGGKLGAVRDDLVCLFEPEDQPGTTKPPVSVVPVSTIEPMIAHSIRRDVGLAAFVLLFFEGLKDQPESIVFNTFDDGSEDAALYNVMLSSGEELALLVDADNARIARPADAGPFGKIRTADIHRFREQFDARAASASGSALDKNPQGGKSE
ncbi:MAG: hypothetical protein AAGJ28_02045 [Pseudomonadota bacterium]